MALVGIGIRQEEGVFRVPADLKEGFELVPEPAGALTLTFWDWGRMLECLSAHGYTPVREAPLERLTEMKAR